MNAYVLRLFIAGNTTRGQKAIATLRRICEEDLGGEYRLEIIDVLERPKLAEQEKIVATPTLIKSLPPPVRRVIGDLSDKEQILIGLDIIGGALETIEGEGQ
jgi:circadian clock protein KaiB